MRLIAAIAIWSEFNRAAKQNFAICDFAEGARTASFSHFRTSEPHSHGRYFAPKVSEGFRLGQEANNRSFGLDSQWIPNWQRFVVEEPRTAS
jgi:hypothetical protein